MAMMAYNPPSSLWRLIEEHISPYEADEIRSMLGESLIEQSLDLHQEVETLLDIWRTLKEESDNNPKTTKLPEPPEIRGRLIQEIIFFVEGVKEKAFKEGIDPERLISKHNSGVISYALQTSSDSTTPRPSSARSNSGRETPMVPSNNSRLNGDVEVARELVSMNDKLNFLQFDEVVSSLRSHLEKETEFLLKDITFLQQCLDDEMCHKDGCGSSTIEREPTLTELREERTLLEKEMLSADILKKKPIVESFRSCISSPTSSAKFRPVPRVLGNITGKPSPLKASHSVAPAIQNIPCLQKTPLAHEKLTLRTLQGISPSRSRIKVVSVSKVLDPYSDGSRTQLTPSPPSTSRSLSPTRPSSASRFRRMVLECRDGE